MKNYERIGNTGKITTYEERKKIVEPTTKPHAKLKRSKYHFGTRAPTELSMLIVGFHFKHKIFSF